MNSLAIELWPHAPIILDKLDSVISKPHDVAKDELLGVLGLDGGLSGPQSVEDSKPGVEDFEYALQAAVMKRLESKEEAKEEEVAKIVELAAEVVAELFKRASSPGSSAAETDRCKTWWMMLVAVAEDTTRLVPAKLLERLVEVFEHSLVRLQAASLQLAMQRLKEFDAKQEAEVKATEDAKDKEAKRVDERKKLIGQLGISPNGHLYLTLTSLLKQLSTRLAGSFNSSLRARISLLLENLLALDHKAIANNQKLRTQDYVVLDDLDDESQATFSGGSAVIAAEAAAEGTEGGEAKEASKASSLGNDPEVDYKLYKNFWGLQVQLQFTEKLFEKPESWQSFSGTLSKILELFMKYPAQDYEKQPWAEQEPAPLRQAPRSRGIGVQLDDPGFRMQFLTQVMIAFQAMEQDVSSRRDRIGGLIAQQNETIKNEFRKLKKTVESTLSQTRKAYPEMLKHVLQRESHWVSWKGFGCREYERESLEMLNGRPLAADSMDSKLDSKNMKPKLEGHISGMLKTLKDPQWKTPQPSSALDEDKLKEAMRPALLRSMCDRYLERLEEEDDPANGIEDEYKAKKNKVFMWQCRRLFAMKHLQVYTNKNVYGKTDFMEFLRAAKTKGQAGQVEADKEDPKEEGNEEAMKEDSKEEVKDEGKEEVNQEKEVKEDDVKMKAEGKEDAEVKEDVAMKEEETKEVTTKNEKKEEVKEPESAPDDADAKRAAPETEEEPPAKKAKQ
mmetsp:Transcript_44946/g.80840  ORF Transcript_44946/g.80840 Transcript_44946/m.80840 type:complete len:730 (+) Transcript_44946:28-2217(+)